LTYRVAFQIGSFRWFKALCRQNALRKHVHVAVIRP
jgi:hypothetical protein